MNTKKVLQIFKTLNTSIPHPTTELNYTSNFELLIAVMLSARTTDKIVNKITEKLFKIANTPEKILKLKTSGVKKQIKSTGFFNTKAANIIKTCEILVKKSHSQIPTTRQELENLPGVGRKTANVILNIAFDKPTIAVDTHVFRVANRVGIVIGKTPEEIETKLLKIVPKKFANIAGNLLLLHGRYTCIAQKPKCTICVINNLCNHKHKTS
ncbi:MAG: endonuclease III [Coxiellaceae bacterium]|nr:endonuclease III [Coxiellaceae bacterium]